MSTSVANVGSNEGERDVKSPVKSPDKLPDGLKWSDLPLFFWKWQFCGYYKLTGAQFRELFHPDLVEAMGISAKEWRHRQKVFRKELLPVMNEYMITAEELKEIAAYSTVS